jgi:hypothetical protein
MIRFDSQAGYWLVGGCLLDNRWLGSWRAAHSFQPGVHDVDAGFVLPTRCEAMNASTSFGKNRTARPILQ